MDEVDAGLQTGTEDAALELPAQHRLRSLDFTDLFFPDYGEPFLRNLAGSQEPISVVPPNYAEDLALLQRRVLERGEAEHEFSVDHDGLRYRVARIDDVDGVSFALRRGIATVPPFRSLGINQRVVQYLGLLGRRRGLILVAGATGDGKTTTVSSLFKDYMVSYGDVGIALEDPPELALHGQHGRFGKCFQVRVRNRKYGKALEATMRYNPRYILIGEIRSSEEASLALSAAINGHVILSTIHASSVQAALHRMLKLVSGHENIDIARDVLAEGLAAVLHQTLVKSKNGRQLRVQFLFPGEDASGIRSKIRQGKIEQLGTEIDQQSTRVMNGHLPVGE